MRNPYSQLGPLEDRDAQIPTRIEFRLKEGVPASSAKSKLIARVVRICFTKISPFKLYKCLLPERSEPEVAYSSIGFNH